jgi:hypothetical protein
MVSSITTLLTLSLLCVERRGIARLFPFAAKPTAARFSAGQGDKDVETEGRAPIWESTPREGVRVRDPDKAQREAENRLAWCEHFRKMHGLHTALADGYDMKLRELENGHRKETA